MQHDTPRKPADRRVLVVVVSDDPDDREALSKAFASDPNYRVMGSCPLVQAPSVIGEQPIDAIIGFVEDEQSWSRFRSLARRFPEPLSVLLLTDPDAVGATADGHALNAVVALGRQELSRKAAGAASEVAREFGVRGTAVSDANVLDRQRLALLTEREREILVHTADGLAIKEIARTINRSYATVASHRNSIMEKLGLHDRVALTRFAIRTGLVEA